VFEREPDQRRRLGELSGLPARSAAVTPRALLDMPDK
jgi:hypothetical protein